MIACLNRGVLQAFLDGGLSTELMESVRRHIETCHTCKREFDCVRENAMEVDVFLDALVPSSVPCAEQNSLIVIPSRPGRFWLAWRVMAFVGAVTIASLVLITTVRDMPRWLSAAGSKATGRATASISIAEAELAARKGQQTQTDRSGAFPNETDFVPLDDGPPIDSATIVRITLPALPANGSGRALRSGIPADVLVDGAGQVRAIRFLN